MKEVRIAAGILSLTWAAFWLWFGLASGIGERLRPLEVLLHAAVPGLMFAASAAIAWRWEPVGGALLLLEGVLVVILYPAWASGRFSPGTIAFVLLTMALPPLLAGLLHLAAWRQNQA